MVVRTKDISDDFLKEAVKSNFSIAGVLRSLGLSDRSGTGYRFVRTKVKCFSLDTSHWSGQGHGSKTPGYKRPLNEILVKNSTYIYTSSLKKRLISEGLLENICDVCSSPPIWFERKLVLVLDHINGTRTDNRITNLRLLCPNCNSQQSTFCRGPKTKYRPQVFSNEEAFSLLREGLSLGDALKRLGVSPSRMHYLRLEYLAQVLKKRKRSFICKQCGKTYYSEYYYSKNCSYSCARKSLQRCERPLRNDLLWLVKNYPMTKIGKKFGVSDNAIRKWCKQYNIPKSEFKYAQVSKLAKEGSSNLSGGSPPSRFDSELG